MNKNLCDKIAKGEVWAIIPARSGSKGLPDKNVKLLQGYPLMAHSIAVGILANNISRTVVSTDSEKYAQIAQKYGADVPFLRPYEYSTDLSQDIDFMKHAIEWFSENENKLPEYWVHLRATCPIRSPEIVEKAIDKIKLHREATSLLSVCIPKGVDTPYKWLVREGDYLRSIFFENNDDSNRPRQTYPTAYCRSIYADVYTTKNIVETETLFGNMIIPFETDKTVDIDELSDFKNAEKLKVDFSIIKYLSERSS